ncbi:MAG: ABC transporter permease, partial [Chloroflexi bacterium]|nr:ABC transporter permease [Chloroflexota bacterium]
MAITKEYRIERWRVPEVTDGKPVGQSVRAEGLERRVPAWVARLAHSPTALLGAAILATQVLLAFFGPLLAPYPSTEFHLADKLQGPSANYLLGTDQFGRDILSRVLHGARGILLLATTSTALGLALGVAVGTIAGYYGGWLDELAMRTMDALMSLPSLLLAMLILTMIGPATPNIVVGIAVVFTPRVARVVRAVVLDLKTHEYVEAARLRGESGLYVMTREILPNALGPIIVEGAIRISYAILLGASLGFLGLGVQPPAADWGLMVSEARNFILIAPWMVL